MTEDVRPRHYRSDEFDSIKSAEWEYWGRGTDQTTGKGEELIGLALSGGGIRSASFALGVLQALYSFRVFDRFNYLSTVSGGGYIGGALTYFRNALPGQFDGEPIEEEIKRNWFPFGYEPPQGPNRVKTMGVRTEAPGAGQNDLARRIVAYLRQHASYLAPSQQFGRPALAAGVLRGLISTLLPYLAMLTALLGLMVCLGFFAPLCAWTPYLPSFLVPSADYFAEPCVDTQKGPPPFYLAFMPAGLAGAIGLILLVVLLGSSIIAGAFHASSHAQRKPEAGYEKLIWLYSWSGRLLVIALVLAAGSTLPLVHAYLGHLWPGNAGGLPADFAGLLAAVGGALGLIGRLRGVVAGEKTKPSMLKAAGMGLAGFAFIYGLLLLAYGISTDALSAKPIVHLASAGVMQFVWPSLGAFALGLAVSLLVNINLATQHRIYRDRLMEVFCAERSALESEEWQPAVHAQSSAGWLIKMKNQRRPFHLINTCVVTTDSRKRRYRGRGGDNFILSPLFYGSDATGWVKTKKIWKELSLPTAIAVSGAALNANSGPHGTGLLRNNAYSALLSLLGLNLGFWARNPMKLRDDPNYRFYIPTLLRPGLKAIFGQNLDEEGAYVQLSDGGHFENLGIYELVRRKVDFLLISDASQDEGFSFEDLANAIERVRVDFGVNLRFQHDDYDLSHVIPGSATSDNPAGQNFVERYHLSTRGYAIGTIEYPDASKGVVVYIKSTLTRGLPGDLYGYKSRNPAYPHQTTLDQFFDEEQFEAYRELGYRLTAKLFRDIEDRRRMFGMDGKTLSDAFDSVIEKLHIPFER